MGCSLSATQGKALAAPSTVSTCKQSSAESGYWYAPALTEFVHSCLSYVPSAPVAYLSKSVGATKHPIVDLAGHVIWSSGHRLYCNAI